MNERSTVSREVCGQNALGKRYETLPLLTNRRSSGGPSKSINHGRDLRGAWLQHDKARRSFPVLHRPTEWVQFHRHGQLISRMIVLPPMTANAAGRSIQRRESMPSPMLLLYTPDMFPLTA